MTEHVRRFRLDDGEATRAVFVEAKAQRQDRSPTANHAARTVPLPFRSTLKADFSYEKS